MEIAGGVHHQQAASWSDYVGLTKPRVAALLLLTCLVAMVLAAGGTPSWRRVILTLVGGYLAAGGAGAINGYLDRDLDARMGRTAQRAIPAGRLDPRHALILGVALGLTSAVVLWFGAHPLAAVLAALAFAHYVVVYTLWLKRRSPWNVVIGGFAGAAPPLVGWAAITGTVDPMALLLAAIILSWTPPHFWALALVRRDEYADADVPMLPVVRGEGPTLRHILAYAALTVVLSTLPVLVGRMGIVYAVAAAALGGVFIYRSVRLLPGVAVPEIRRFYFFTLLYLAALFLAMLVDWRAGW